MSFQKVSISSCAEPQGPDALIACCGTIWTICPLSAEGKLWVQENISMSPSNWIGNVLCIEHRFVLAIVTGMQEVGLEMQFR